MGLDIDQLVSNVNSKVIICMPSEKISVTGFVTEELSGSGQANYSDLFETGAQESLSKTLTQVGTLAGSLGITEVFGKDISFSQVQLVTTQQTVAMYTGSSKPSFTIPLIFVALKPEPNQDPRIRVNALHKATYPGKAELGGTGIQFLKSPLGYFPSFKNGSARNTVSFAIGTWFRAMNMLITNVSYSFSKEITKLGFPLYAKASVTFESYRILTADEVSEFFIGVRDAGVGIEGCNQ